MKKIPMLFLSALVVASACSSPTEKHEERQADAKREYNKEMKESQEEYQEEDLETRRDKAKDMVDNSDELKVDKSRGKIQVDE